MNLLINGHEICILKAIGHNDGYYWDMSAKVNYLGETYSIEDSGSGSGYVPNYSAVIKGDFERLYGAPEVNVDYEDDYVGDTIVDLLRSFLLSNATKTWEREESGRIKIDGEYCPNGKAPVKIVEDKICLYFDVLEDFIEFCLMKKNSINLCSTRIFFLKNAYEEGFKYALCDRDAPDEIRIVTVNDIYGSVYTYSGVKHLLIPKKITGVNRVIHNQYGSKSFSGNYCRACGFMINSYNIKEPDEFFYDNYHFCNRCGTIIDWDDICEEEKLIN